MRIITFSLLSTKNINQCKASFTIRYLLLKVENMKKSFFLMLFLLLVTSFTAKAGDQFVPKTYSYAEVGSSADKNLFVYFYDLFTYPDAISTKTDISKIDTITIYASSGDESIIKLTTIGQHMNQTRLQLKRVGQSKGETTFTVSITYRGETITNTFPVKVYGVTTSGKKTYLHPDSASVILDPFMSANFYKDVETIASTLTIDNASELKYGTAELVDGGNGYKVIKYTQTGSQNHIVSEVIKYTITLSDASESSSNIFTTYITKNCYSTKIVEYQPAAGQFRVENAWDNPNNGSGLSLGALGGYVVYGFDQPIYNNPQNPYGVDFTIEGNSFVANEKGVWTEPGAVQVMEDKNGDGIPNDGEWYELAGSDYWLSTTKHNVEITYYNPNYNDRYAVPWTLKWEENGETHYEHGCVVTNNFHKHTFYPDYFYNQDNPNPAYRWYNPNISRDSITFTGLNYIRGCIDMRAPTYIQFYNYSGFGYCDNKGFVKDDSRIAQNPYGRPALGETAGDGMDISWAVDKNGNYVDLEKIDFVKVYTAGQVVAGWLGEWSTEASICAITLPDPTYVPRDYYYNYVGITQLQVPKGHTCKYDGILFKNGRPVKDATPHWWITTDKEGKLTEGASAIATIDNTGLLTAHDYGTVWVHFSAMDSIPQESFEVSVSNLKSVVISLEGITGPTSDKLSCVVGERVYINVESEDASSDVINESISNRFIYDTYTWLNSNPEVGTIDQGNFIALKPGVTTLTAVSNINPNLSDQIEITVLDVPEIVINPIQIATNQPTGELLNTNLFSTSINATVYMDEVVATKDNVKVSLYNNHLFYEFTQGKYATDILKCKVTFFGKKYDLEVPITYGPYNLATRKKLLMSNTFDSETFASLTNTRLEGIDAETYASKVYVDEMTLVSTDNPFPTDNILVDGAYAYVAQGASLIRYDVEWGKTIATATLSSTDRHALAVYKDKLLVGDGSSLKVFYRTDLEAFKSITINGSIKQITLKGDALYILATDEGVAQMNVLNLTTWTLTASNIELAAGANASGMYLYNDKLYIATGEYLASPASIVEFNTANNTSTLHSATIEGNIQLPHSTSAIAGDNIILSRGVGFITYNITTGSFGSESILSAGDQIPLLAVGETFVKESVEYQRYYIAYNQGLYVYESDDLTQPKQTIVAIPSAMTLMAATDENEAPTVKKAYTYNSSMYERATKVTNCSAAQLKNYFNDNGGTGIDNIYMYIREDVDWMEITYDASGKLTPKGQYSGDLDANTDFAFTFECIDKYGASVKTTATFTVKSRIYKPVISEREINIKSIADSTVVVRKAISSIFDNSENKKCSFVNTLNVSENNLFAAEIVNDTLVITVSNYVSGNATIELTQVIKHNTTSYGEKTFTATIPVVVEKAIVLADSIALDATEKEVLLGEEFTLVATVLPANTTNPAIVWATSNDSVATVVDGKVVAVGVGEATITVATTDGSNLTATCRVVVKPALATSIALDITEKEAYIGEEFTLTATVLPTNTTNPAIAWSTSDSTIATVVDGKVVAIGVGEATITVATTDGSNLTATCRVVVVKPILVSIDKVENNFVVTTENKNIVITSTTDNSIVRVFTVTGAHIGDGHIYAGKATIAVPVRGIYVVYVDNKATKVIVK